MHLRILAAASVVTLLFSGSAFAQNPLEGVWEHSARPGTLTIYTSEGVYAVIPLPPGRPKVEKPMPLIDEAAFQAAFTNHWIPAGADHAAHMIAHTPLAGPQGTVEVTFTVPPPGSTRSSAPTPVTGR